MFVFTHKNTILQHAECVFSCVLYQRGTNYHKKFLKPLNGHCAFAKKRNSGRTKSGKRTELVNRGCAGASGPL